MQHYPRCKSFIPRIEAVQASLSLVWDMRPVLSACRNRYPLAGDRPLQLYSSLNAPFPEKLCATPATPGSVPADMDALAALLFAREKEYASVLKE